MSKPWIRNWVEMCVDGANPKERTQKGFLSSITAFSCPRIFFTIFSPPEPSSSPESSPPPLESPIQPISPLKRPKWFQKHSQNVQHGPKHDLSQNASKTVVQRCVKTSKMTLSFLGKGWSAPSNNKDPTFPKTSCNNWVRKHSFCKSLSITERTLFEFCWIGSTPAASKCQGL